MSGIIMPDTEVFILLGHIALMKGVLSCGSMLMQNGTFVQKCFEEIIKFCNQILKQ
jgi:hypothetical protein